MKKKIITISVIIVAIIGIIIGVNYFLSFKEITFNLSTDVTKITIYKKTDYVNKKDPMEVSSSQPIKLQTGDYTVIPSGDKVATDQIHITISQKTEIKIDPNYSKYYLSSILPTEQSSILGILKLKYPTIMNNYTIQQAGLFKKGQWFGGLLVNNQTSPNSKKDLFRFVAYKENNIWQIISYPDLILTKKVYSTVPVEILNTINKLETDFKLL